MTVDWQGHKVAEARHVSDLEKRAAILEFGHGLSRREAENQAYSEHLREMHLEAAAHHLAGQRGARAAGSIKDARRHGEAYAAHLRALGLPSVAAVPREVQERLANVASKVYRFRPHPADELQGA